MSLAGEHHSRLPNSELSINLIEGLPVAQNGWRSITTITCVSSRRRYMGLYGAPTSGSGALVEAMFSWVPIHGVPHLIRSEGDIGVVRAAIPELLRRLNISTRPDIRVFSLSRRQGRIQTEVGHHIRARCQDEPERWHLLLPWIQLECNTLALMESNERGDNQEYPLPDDTMQGSSRTESGSGVGSGGVGHHPVAAEEGNWNDIRGQGTELRHRSTDPDRSNVHRSARQVVRTAIARIKGEDAHDGCREKGTHGVKRTRMFKRAAKWVSEQEIEEARRRHLSLNKKPMGRSEFSMGARFSPSPLRRKVDREEMTADDSALWMTAEDSAHSHSDHGKGAGGLGYQAHWMGPLRLTKGGPAGSP